MDVPEHIEQFFRDIAGSWDGDLPGVSEDRAHIANDILELITELKST